MAHEYPLFNLNVLTVPEINDLLQSYHLALTPDEALHLQNAILKRSPTLAECVLWSIQGSEHCSYKSSKKYLKTLISEGPNVLLGAKEDAGIVTVAIDNQGKRYGIVMSHESHNHPSQIVPYEGAATGIGGNIRDVCCMGAEVIALADGLRFGDLSRPKTHWIYDGVVAGISGYGNAVGVPNIAGDVYFDAAYNENCLVTVVTLGVVHEDQIIHSYVPPQAKEYIYILVGKATDNSGFGGASFASQNLSHGDQEHNKGAVQEPNAFLKRHLLKANYSLFRKLHERSLISQVGFKDLGAGGIACASVEMAEAGGYGAEINVDLIPTSMPNLAPHVVLCSETQERFMWVVPEELVEMILDHYNVEFVLPEISHGACAAVIGKVRSDPYYLAYSQGKTLINALASDITQGIVSERPIKSRKINTSEPLVSWIGNANETLLKLLAHENIASKQPIIETYDKQVQGRTLFEAGDTDAGLIVPFNEDKYPPEIRHVGVALSLDQNPRYNAIDPYWGAVNAVVEAARNVAAVGASPQAITDCLCFGNPENPEHMWELTESIRGIRDACKVISLKDYPNSSLPVIAGNVSLYNESPQGPIPPSPMISCLGSMPDARKAVSSHLKHSNSHLVLIGERKNECGGSVYYQLHGHLGTYLPKPNLNTLAVEIHTVIEAIQQGLILSSHDISDGGIAVTLAEMSFKNHIGLEVVIPSDLSDDKILFSESGGFVLEVSPLHLAQLSSLLQQNKVPFWLIGTTQVEPILKMQNQVNLPIHAAKERWENGLREHFI